MEYRHGLRWSGEDSESGGRRRLFIALNCATLLVAGGSLTHIRVFASVLSMTTTNQSISGRITVNTLPDDVLVDIFYFYVNDWDIGTSGWHALVHVCQRWRHIVLGSPRRLNLRLVYRGIMSEMQDRCIRKKRKCYVARYSYHSVCSNFTTIKVSCLHSNHQTLYSHHQGYIEHH
ncbi:hypothetical protein F5148DRAFT_758450 [Russula earlei]|uniref:Uncharacterized protein n=1 Tax=Russula earlei TaxID=71964 RepID=A0ACC0TUE6_9AGAM|nr:hypothetical protein F5148DRAFT_758450 [Russula earlei]